jgi:hypothetical protein
MVADQSKFRVRPNKICFAPSSLFLQLIRSGAQVRPETFFQSGISEFITSP